MILDSTHWENKILLFIMYKNFIISKIIADFRCFYSPERGIGPNIESTGADQAC